MASWITRLATRARTVVATLDNSGSGGAFDYFERRIVALEARIMRLEAASPPATEDPDPKRLQR
jgi:hypothetical protein